jgi:hypothetical protein
MLCMLADEKTIQIHVFILYYITVCNIPNSKTYSHIILRCFL